SCYEQGLAIHQAVGDRNGESIVLSNLGVLQFQQGRFAEASTSYEAALAGCGKTRAARCPHPPCQRA
ncbi:MAG: tetratricopeptide repeat protein, partial [Proteobacteria bacterium]|nr:tetratricopeptide repeat protein [Pseudomonadota bacterium]